MQFSPLYLVLIPDDSQSHLPYDRLSSILQLRRNVEPLTGIQTRRNAQGETVLALPPPVMEIARGHQDDLYGLAAKMFGARWGAWTYHGDYVHSYQLQRFDGIAPPGLTPREKSILRVLECKPGQTIDDLYLFLQVGRPTLESDKAQISSALRFLYENGFVVVSTYQSVEHETPGHFKAQYTIRRT